MIARPIIALILAAPAFGFTTSNRFVATEVSYRLIVYCILPTMPLRMIYAALERVVWESGVCRCSRTVMMAIHWYLGSSFVSSCCLPAEIRIRQLFPPSCKPGWARHERVSTWRTRRSGGVWDCVVVERRWHSYYGAIKWPQGQGIPGRMACARDSIRGR